MLHVFLAVISTLVKTVCFIASGQSDLIECRATSLGGQIFQSASCTCSCTAPLPVPSFRVKKLSTLSYRCHYRRLPSLISHLKRLCTSFSLSHSFYFLLSFLGFFLPFSLCFCRFLSSFFLAFFFFLRYLFIFVLSACRM